MARISAVIMTLNEEHNVEFALRSVRPWCDEVIVVDMMSDDRTQEIARRYVDQLLTHERVGFVEPARVQGFAAATGDWIINIDADEVVSPGLARSCGSWPRATRPTTSTWFRGQTCFWAAGSSTRHGGRASLASSARER